jgi:hypothetical protein
MENLDHILLFKTNISHESDEKLLNIILDNNPDIQNWSIDMDDIDCVLRIESYTLSHNEIIELINHHGYKCRELI